MLRWIADENFNNDILRALFRRNSTLDIVRAQDVGLSGLDDSSLLAWAAEATRVLLTHDVSTMTAYAYERVRNRDRMPGVFEVSREVPIRLAIEDILLISECSRPEEWEGQVRYLRSVEVRAKPPAPGRWCKTPTSEEAREITLPDSRRASKSRRCDSLQVRSAWHPC